MSISYKYSRRSFLAAAGLLTAGVVFKPWRAFAESESPVTVIRGSAASVRINIHRLRGNLSVLEGSGGNIAVLTGKDGKLLVDAGITASKPRIMEALDDLSPEPIKHVINTHWHFDHTDGNEWLHEMGAQITAHENTRKHLSKTTRVDAWNFTFPPAPQSALPSRVFKKDLKLRINGEELILHHYKPGHTDSDISVVFPKADVLQTGDTWWNGHYPFIDHNTGGSIDGMIRAANQNIKRTSRETIVIPGHGPVGGRADLIEYHEMLVTIRDRVASLAKQGKPLEEVLAAKPTADYDAKWGGFVINGSTFASLIFADVRKQTTKIASVASE